MNTISERLRLLREKKNISIEELSNNIKIPVSTLRDLEAGHFDKYTGEELYVKNYLKKIATYLDAEDTDEIVSDYIHFTQEIALTKIQEVSTQEITEPKKVLMAKKATYTRKKSVYEDKYLVRYAKYLIGGILILAIISIIWMILSSSILSAPKEEATQPFDDVGDVELNDDAYKDDQVSKDEEVPEDVTPESTLKIVNTGLSNFEVSGLEENEAIKIEVSFNHDSTFSLWLNSAIVEGSYNPLYKAGENFLYESTFVEGDNYVLNIWNYQDVVIKINDQIVEFDPLTVEEIDGVSYFRLFMKGSNNESA